MRVRIIWPITLALFVAMLFATVIYQRSWIPFYQEAEPLYPTVADLGSELATLNSKQPVTGADIQNLLAETRFEAIRPYGVVFSKDPDLIVSIRVNRKFSFDIPLDGRPRWNKK